MRRQMLTPVLLALLAAAPQARPARAAAEPAPPPLAEALLAALRGAGLSDLHDAGADEGRCPGEGDCPWPLPPALAAPVVDLAVIRLDAEGRAVEAANVQVDAASPEGRVVLLDRDLAASGVRFRRWSPARREAALAGLAPAPFEASDDLSPRRPQGVDFMSPYPASLFKLLVAFHVERRIAEGALSPAALLEGPEGPPPDPAAYVDPSQAPPAPPERLPLSTWVERMITTSDNPATKVVLRHLHERGEVARLNAGLASLGLDTLRIDGTNPADGGRWAPGEIHAGAMDVARLLWLVAGGPGVSWRAPDGSKVTQRALPEPARRRLRALLADQAIHEALSSGSLCGTGPFGIPALVPDRWVDRTTGQALAGDAAFGRDVRPCNQAAEVRFLHKTGLTWNYASDAGIVEPLPGRPFRRYVVAVISSCGTRFVDPERAAAPRHPCQADQVCLTRGLATLGAAIDAHLVWAARAKARPRPGAARPAATGGAAPAGGRTHP